LHEICAGGGEVPGKGDGFAVGAADVTVLGGGLSKGVRSEKSLISLLEFQIVPCIGHQP